MSKAKLLLLSVAGAICIFAGSTTVNASDYNSLKKEYDQLKKDYDALKNDYDEMAADYYEYVRRYAVDKYSAKLEDIKLQSSLETSYPGKVKCSSLDKEQTVYQAVIQSDYTAKEIDDIIKEAGYNTSIFNGLYGDSFVGDTIYLKYLDKYTDELCEFQLVRKNGKFEVESFTMNYEYLKDISDSLGGN